MEWCGAVASGAGRVHIGRMIATVGRGSPEPIPRPTLAGSVLQGSGAPQFAVQFSRPRALPSRPDSRTNSYRWTGPGTIHILERGMLVMTRRRSPFGFRTADERFIAAAEICEVFREGDSVRVDLHGDAKTGGFFQFWTGNAAIAGTIVRLLPTTRTIEYESETAEQAPSPRAPLSLHRRRRERRRLVSAALIVGLVAVGALLVTDIVVRKRALVVPVTVNVPLPTTQPVVSPPSAVPHATLAEIEGVAAELRAFDDRMDGLRAQYRTASDALQSGHLAPYAFVHGIDSWLVPQWRTLYGEQAARIRNDGSLASAVHGKLMDAATGWEQGLQDYADGLLNHNYNAVIAAFDRMSNGNESRREAWRMVEQAEFDAASQPADAGHR